MKAAFVLAWRTLVRGRFLSTLALVTAATAFFLPKLVRTDGSLAGAREMYLRSIPGCAVAVVSVAILCAACGHLARARENNLLALAVLRPSSAFKTLSGIWLAYLLCAAVILSSLATVVYFAVPGGALRCRHHIAPVMPSPVIAARAALESYLADPNTPEAVRKAPRHAVLSLLASKEADRYDPIPPGATVQWVFPSKWAASTNLSLRVRFATQFELRTSLHGEFVYGSSRAVISNNTQAVLEVPLTAAEEVPSEPGGKGPTVNASFTNKGKDTVMLRPRCDIFLLAPADSFLANLTRSFLQVFSGVALAAAFGLFLSSALSRPVAVFTALVACAVIFMAPSVIAQYPDELDVASVDKIGLMFSRTVYNLTSPLSEASPIADLAEDRYIGGVSLARAFLFNVVLLPLFFLSAASFLARRKPLPEI